VSVPRILNQQFLRRFLIQITRFHQKRINSVRGTHKGECCYIFGDGVSLKYFDLKNFQNFPAIITAKIPLHLEVKYLDARYWVLPEPMFCWPTPWTPNSRTERRLHSPHRVRRLGIQPIMHATNFPYTIGAKSYFIFDDFLDNALDETFITRQMSGFTSSFTAAISTAIYLGFSKAYLVGFDYTHRPSRVGHWYEQGPGNLSDHSNYSKEFIERAQHDIQLTTVTLDGVGDVLPHISYQELTGNVPRLRNQHELVSEYHLQLLKKLPFYEI
jgi:hypothetical protein